MKKKITFLIFTVLAVLCVVYSGMVLATGSGTSFFLVWIGLAVLFFLFGQILQKLIAFIHGIQKRQINRKDRRFQFFHGFSQHRYGYYSTASRNEQHKIAVFATRVVLAGKPPCLPPWGKVAPQGRMRGRFPGGRP